MIYFYSEATVAQDSEVTELGCVPIWSKALKRQCTQKEISIEVV